MALINCTECSNKISDKAPACPHCGVVFESDEPTVKIAKKEPDLTDPGPINRDKPAIQIKASSKEGKTEPKVTSEFSRDTFKGIKEKDKTKESSSIEGADSNNQINTTANEWKYIEQAPAFISVALLFTFLFYIGAVLAVDWANSQQDEFMREKHPIPPFSMPFCIILGLVSTILLWSRGMHKWFAGKANLNASPYSKKKTISVWVFMCNYLGLILLFIIIWALLSFLVSLAMIAASYYLEIQALRGTYVYWVTSGFIMTCAVWVKLRTRFH
jgi:hypothetical protein